VAEKRPIPKLRWWMAALLFCATVINYVDRQALSVMAPVIMPELGLSNIDYSNVLQAFLICYTSMYLLAGYLIDRWGTRMALAVSMVWWSVANMLHATSRDALSLGIFRALLGIGESGNFLAAEKAISEWFPPKERGVANGLVNAAAATGAILAPPLIVWIYGTWGWRFAFLLTGGLGFLWLYFWLTWYWTPAKHSRIGEDERELLAGPAKSVRRPLWWRQLFGFRQTWGLFLARVIADPVWWFYLFWLPKYLSEERGFTMVEIGLVAWMPYLTADIGSILGGWASGRLIRRGTTPLNARKLTMLPCALMMPLGLLVAFSESSTVAVATICLITFAHMAWKTNLMTMTNDIYPTAIVGSVAGIVGLGSGLGGTIFTRITGYVVEGYSYQGVFVIMAFLHPIALLVLHSLIKGPLEDQPVEAAKREAAVPETPTEKAA